MRKSLPVLILLSVAVAIFLWRLERVYVDDLQSKQIHPKFPEGLSRGLEAKPISKLRLDHPVRNVYAFDGYAFCAGKEPVLEVVEIGSDSWFGNPSLQHPLPAPVQGVQGIGNRLILFLDSKETMTLDVSDPENIQEVKTEVTAPPVDWLIAGEKLFIGPAQGENPIYEMSEEGALRRVGVYPTGHDLIQRGSIRGRTAFLVNGWSGIQVVDLTYPFSPIFETLIPIDGCVVDLCFVNDHLVVCRQSKSPLILDWSEGANRDPIGELEERGSACIAYGEKAFVGYSRWVYGYDFSTPHSPTLEKVYPGFPHHLAFWEDKVLIPQGEDGVWVYQLDGILEGES